VGLGAEQPRTDEQGVSAEGREQPVIEPQVDETPTPAADAPDATTPEEPIALDQSDGESAEKPKTARKPAAKKAPAAKAKPAAKRTMKKDDEKGDEI